MARTASPQTRPALVEAAGRLFYSRGIAATGVDDIAGAAGLTKPTLYRHFASKEALVGVYLDERHEQLDNELRAWLNAAAPSERPAVVIEWLCDWICRPDFDGCAFVRGHAELHGDAEVLAKARKRKRVLRERIMQACRDARVAEPGELAEQLALIVEGATTTAFISDDSKRAAATARSLALAALKCADGALA
jgi:AcrR family transcriptional regulator